MKTITIKLDQNNFNGADEYDTDYIDGVKAGRRQIIIALNRAGYEVNIEDDDYYLNDN